MRGIKEIREIIKNSERFRDTPTYSFFYYLSPSSPASPHLPSKTFNYFIRLNSYLFYYSIYCRTVGEQLRPVFVSFVPSWLKIFAPRKETNR